MNQTRLSNTPPVVTRRQFICRATLALVAGLGWRLPHAAVSTKQVGGKGQQQKEVSSCEAAAEEVRALVVQHLADQGFEQIPAAPMLTGQDFNGGLRYDESGVLDRAGPRSLIVQDCARVADIQERSRLCVLPYFHILACRHGGDRDVPAVIEHFMEVLVELVGLRGETLALVSTEKLLPHRTILEKHGISADARVFIRDAEQARAAGDGSGYFAPHGHPAVTGIHTAGVYAWVGKGTPQPVAQHPVPQGWVEVGEIALEPNAPTSFGIGLERVALARYGSVPSWRHGLAKLLSRIE